VAIVDTPPPPHVVTGVVFARTGKPPRSESGSDEAGDDQQYGRGGVEKIGQTSNRADKKKFEEAVRRIERQIGRILDQDDRRELHNKITGWNYRIQQIVDEGLNLFGRYGEHRGLCPQLERLNNKGERPPVPVRIPFAAETNLSRVIVLVSGLSRDKSIGNQERRVHATKDDLNQILRIVEPVLGLRAWDVRLGQGSFVTANFGSPLPPRPRTGAVYGEWYLWIQHAPWRVEQDGDIVAGSDDSREKLQGVLNQLDGRPLVSFDILAPALDSVFTFDGDLTVRLFTASTEQYDSWVLFTPSDYVLKIGPGPSWALVRRS